MLDNNILNSKNITIFWLQEHKDKEKGGFKKEGVRVSTRNCAYIREIAWLSRQEAFSLEEEWIELTQLRLLLVSLIRIKILLYAISWNLRET